MKPGSREHIHAIILAEGGSARLRPLSDHLPTSLLPVGGTPILDHQLQALRACGIRTITVVGGYRAVQVEQACRFYPGVRFLENPEFSRTEPTLNGLRMAEAGGGSLLLVHGELLTHRDLLDEFLDREGEWIGLVDAAGRSAGLELLRSDLTELLLEAAAETQDSGTALFSFLEAALPTKDRIHLELSRRLWSRVESMEDLAVSLRKFRRADANIVSAREEPTAKPQVPPRKETVPAGRVASGLAGPSDVASSPAPLLTRPLFKTLPH